MPNFDFLLKDKDFEPFASVAVTAERLLHVDAASCVLACDGVCGQVDVLRWPRSCYALLGYSRRHDERR